MADRAPDPPGAARPPRRLGRYRLLRPIGSGAVGTVYLAADTRGGAPVALKTVALDDDESRRRFDAEAAALRRLQHPGIVAVLDAGRDARTGWLAMELLRGCDLVRYTQPARLLPEAVALGLGERLARALAHAHAAGIVHRDVKPSNVIVDWAARRLTLTDFGLARLDDAARTKTGVVAGSPEYMAPELLAGAPASPASDVYALGVLVYELLAGRRPHAAPTLGALLQRLATEPAPDLRTLRPALPAPVAQAVAWALAARAGDRPADAAQWADALRTAAAALAPSGAA